MAKASRSSKKQPDFDPSEIEDLIFSPAVGKGVGSHLVAPVQVTTEVITDLATVAMAQTVDTSVATTMVVVDKPTVAMTGYQSTIVATTDVSTVARPTSATTQLWITEHGDLVSPARVKRIRLAQDVINSAEESVYDTLWNAKLVTTDEAGRLVQAGYDYLVKRTRLSRKTIQRIIAKLLEKDFIEVDTRADIYQRAATVYRVFSYKAVLERNAKKGRLYVAKMGPGFAYARPLQGSDLSATETPSDMPTVDMSDMTSIVDEGMATVAKATTVTVAKIDRPTVVKMSPHLLDTKYLDKSSSSPSPPEVRAALGQYGPVDDDVAVQLIAACRSYTPDCTVQEIVHFIDEKGSHVRKRDSRVHNPLGFLLTAVPKCFSGELLAEYRAEQGRARASGPTTGESDIPDDPALLRWRKEQEAALSDPAVSEQEKHLIRLCLGLNVP
jgi:hypothetical protein